MSRPRSSKNTNDEPLSAGALLCQLMSSFPRNGNDRRFGSGEESGREYAEGEDDQQAYLQGGHVMSLRAGERGRRAAGQVLLGKPNWAGDVRRPDSDSLRTPSGQAGVGGGGNSRS